MTVSMGIPEWIIVFLWTSQVISVFVQYGKDGNTRRVLVNMGAMAFAIFLFIWAGTFS